MDSPDLFDLRFSSSTIESSGVRLLDAQINGSTPLKVRSSHGPSASTRLGPVHDCQLAHSSSPKAWSLTTKEPHGRVASGSLPFEAGGRRLGSGLPAGTNLFRSQISPVPGAIHGTSGRAPRSSSERRSYGSQQGSRMRMIRQFRSLRSPPPYSEEPSQSGQAVEAPHFGQTELSIAVLVCLLHVLPKERGLPLRHKAILVPVQAGEDQFDVRAHV